PTIKGGAYSSIPSKLPAYMFSGKPIIACVDKNSETERCIFDAQCGWIIEPENEEQLIQIFRQVLNLPQNTLKKMGNNAYEYGKLYFSKEINLQKLLNLFIL
ncbi:MAG: putative glycosyltransferase, partial [Mucilaginibacter sp.]|nr:putative glycosyltransferase [Mucilaginibacter sp.]